MKNKLSINQRIKACFILLVSGSLHSTTLEKSKDDFMECDVVKCCKRGPITDEKYCPYCGKIIIRSNDR